MVKSTKKSHKVKKRKRRLKKASPQIPPTWDCPMCGVGHGPLRTKCTCGFTRKGNEGARRGKQRRAS